MRDHGQADSPVKREYPDAPLVGVGAIIIDQDRVLLVKRGQAPLAGNWSIPGGALELGETLRQAVIREALEETGLTVEAGELLGVYDRIVQDAEGRPRYHYVLIDFLCRKTAGELHAAGDAADARWFTRSDLAGLQLPEDTTNVIKLGFEKSGSI
jgi:8-oxo-dGTP diphosphatase